MIVLFGLCYDIAQIHWPDTFEYITWTCIFELKNTCWLWFRVITRYFTRVVTDVSTWNDLEIYVLVCGWNGYAVTNDDDLNTNGTVEVKLLIKLYHIDHWRMPMPRSSLFLIV